MSKVKAVTIKCVILKAGFLACVSRRHKSARYLSTYTHQCSQSISALQQKPACSQKSCTCWTFVSGCKACATICCDCDLCKPKTQYTENIFCLADKKSKTKELFWKNSFRKVVISNLISDALCDLHTSESKRPRNRTYDGCLYSRANNSELLAHWNI